MATLEALVRAADVNVLPQSGQLGESLLTEAALVRLVVLLDVLFNGNLALADEEAVATLVGAVVLLHVSLEAGRGVVGHRALSTLEHWPFTV